MPAGGKMVHVIRNTRPSDAEGLRRIERAAGARFRDIGMDDVAADEPLPAVELVAAARAGRSWVAVDGDDRAVGYVVVEVVDGCAHIGQLSVEPDHQGRGLARDLVGQVEEWAATRALSAVTLTTFRDVPWNRPFYEHLGFEAVLEEELGPGLRALRVTEGPVASTPRPVSARARGAPGVGRARPCLLRGGTQGPARCPR